MKLAAVILLAVALLASTCFAQTADLIISKDFVDDYFVVDRNLTITYSFHNIGEASAYDIHVIDDSFNSEFFKLVEGSFEGTIDEIASGENKTHTFVVVPLVVGEYRDVSGHIAYRRFKDAPVTSAQSSFVGTYTILTEVEYQTLYADHTVEWAIFVGLSVIPTLLPLGIYYVNLNQADKPKSA